MPLRKNSPTVMSTALAVISTKSLSGAILSGFIYQQFGLVSCLILSTLLIAASGVFAGRLTAQTD